MGSPNKFIDSQKKYEMKLGSIMNWAFIKEQSKGSSYDYISPDGSKIEGLGVEEELFFQMKYNIYSILISQKYILLKMEEN